MNTKTLKPDALMIMQGILKGYYDDADMIIQQVKQTVTVFSKKMNEENDKLSPDFVNIVSLASSLYVELKKKSDKENALSITKLCFLPFAFTIQMKNFHFVDEERTFSNLIKRQQNVNKTGPTRFNRMEIIQQDDHRYKFHVHNCMFKDMFQKLGMPELTEIMCSIDNITFNSYMPDSIIFHREESGNTIAKGKSFCTFVCDNIDK